MTTANYPSDYKETEAKAFEGAERYRRSRDNSSIDFSGGRGSDVGEFMKGLEQQLNRKKEKEEDSDALLKKMMKAKNLNHKFCTLLKLVYKMHFNLVKHQGMKNIVSWYGIYMVRS